MSISEKEKKVLKEIRDIDICRDIDNCLEGRIQLPQYYCEDESNIKAVVLGCDPSNDRGYEFKKAFGLDNEDKEKHKGNFFNAIETNLKAVSLDKSNVYVQNLCRNYFFHSTSYFFNKNADNKYKWIGVAEKWVDLLKDDLDEIDKGCSLPVLITSEYLIEPLLKPEYSYIKKKADFYYSNRDFREHGYITKVQNKLGRTVIPFFRNHEYFLDEKKLSKNINDYEYKKKRNIDYRNYLIGYIDGKNSNNN